MNIKTNIFKDNNTHINGFILVGDNNTGKTYQILDILKDLISVVNDQYYEVSTSIYLSKLICTGDISSGQMLPSSISDALGGTPETFESILSSGEPIEIDFTKDLINTSELKTIIFNSIVDKESYYNGLFKDLLSINLLYDKDSKEILIFSEEEFREFDSKQEPNDTSSYYLKSSGYISLIRIIVILDNLLDSTVEWILIDEPDASLDFNNSQSFIKIIESLKVQKGSNAKIIFSSHDSETIYSLPENYIIYKLVNKKVLEKYYSQDFFSKAKLEAKLFNMKNINIYRGEKINTLLHIYRDRLEGVPNNTALSSFVYNDLSIKEKIIYNAINKLGV